MRFGVREICDVVFKARTDMYIGKEKYVKGQPVLYIDTAKTSTLEGAATTVYAQGGQGNPRLIAWESEKTVTFTVEDALLSPISFAMLSGAGLANFNSAGNQESIHVHNTVDVLIDDGGVVEITGAALGLHDDEVKKISTKGSVFGMILDNAGAGVKSCKADPISSELEIPAEGEGVKITFPDAAQFVGRTMRVDFYIEEKGHATEFSIDAENFAGNFYVEASTLFREQSTAKDMPAEIVFPNVKIQSNFTFEMSASGDPSTFTFTMDALPAYTQFDPTHKVFAAIQVIGEENVKPETSTKKSE